MKSKFLFQVLLVSGLMLVNFSVYQVYSQTTQNKPTKQQTVKYTCPEHPEVVQENPGNCPKCGKMLVEKKEELKGNKHQRNDSCSMKHDHKKMVCDSTTMKKGHMKHDSTMMKKCYMMQDSTMMKKCHMKHDSTMMKNGHMMHDTTSMKHDHMKM